MGDELRQQHRVQALRLLSISSGARIGALSLASVGISCLWGQPPLTTLYSFSGHSGDGANPSGGLVVGAGGSLYGTTAYGGIFGAGTVFELSPPSAGGAWTETVIYNFTGGNDGGYPQEGVTLGSGGALYGAALYGGASGMGTVFELAPPGAGGVWTESVIYSFSGSDGAYPYTPPLVTQSGLLYGTTELGGLGYGAVYRLRQAQGGAWTETVLHSFTGAGDGSFPYGGLAIDANGNLYGTAAYGGTGNGVVFELAKPAKSGSAWTETVLHAFKGTDGGYPFAGVVFDAKGNLYGTTSGGVGTSFGTAFELSPPASGKTWKQTVLVDFKSGANGGTPHAVLTLTQTGALLGTDLGGGAGPGFSGYGLIFELVPPVSGNAWTETILHDFQGTNDGGDPLAPLVPGANGVFYSTTLRGGTYGSGTVYAMTP